MFVTLCHCTPLATHHCQHVCKTSIIVKLLSSMQKKNKNTHKQTYFNWQNSCLLMGGGNAPPCGPPYTLAQCTVLEPSTTVPASGSGNNVSIDYTGRTHQHTLYSLANTAHHTYCCIVLPIEKLSAARRCRFPLVKVRHHLHLMHKVVFKQAWMRHGLHHHRRHHHQSCKYIFRYSFSPQKQQQQ